MSSKITLTMDNQTGAGLEQVRKDLARMGIEGTKSEKAMEALNNELSSRDAADQAVKIKKLADEYDHLNGVVRSGAKDMKPTATGWTELASKVSLAKMALHGVYEGTKKAFEGISYLASQGAPAFQELENAGRKAMDSLTAAASGEGIAKGAKVASVAIERVLIPMMGEASKVVNNLGEAAYATTDRLAAMAGVDFSKQIADMERVAQKLARIKKELAQEATIKTGKIEGEKIEERRDATRAQRAKDRLIEEQTSSAGVEKLIDQETAHYNAMREKMKTANAADQAAFKAAAERAAADLDKLEEKHTELVKTEVAARFEKHKKLEEDKRTISLKTREVELKGLDEILSKHKAGSDEFRSAEKRKLELIKKTKDEELSILKNRDGIKETEHAKDMERIQSRADKEIAAIKGGMEAEQAAWNAREARKQAEDAAQQAKVDKLKQALGGGGMGGGAGAGGPDFMGQLAGGIRGKDIQRQILKQREDAALSKWRESQRGTGKMDQNNRLLAGESDEFSMGRDRLDNSSAALDRRTKAQENAIRRQSRMQAFKDARRGKISNEEVADAQGALADSTVDLISTGNNLSGIQTEAIKQLTSTATQAAQEQARQADSLRQVFSVLNQLQGRGNNSTNRAQRAGG